ncbi:MAG TPA: threonine--tRNA ligase, partial [Thermosulfidibacter takaii]|nr:threonine--tRNA ligase [Thermosulfidibacter takaii]
AMVHRVILGSIDRFLGVLIEHYAGAFPLWLAPVQARVMNITDDQAEYAGQVADRLTQDGFRVEADLRNEKLGAKVRDAQMEKIPYMLIVGKREVAGGRVAVRHRRQGDLGPMELEEIIQRMRHEVEVKASE